MMTQMMGGHSDERYEAAWEEYANDIPPEEPPTDEEMEELYRHYNSEQAQ